MGVDYSKLYSCPLLQIDTITDINKIVNCVINGSLKGTTSETASPTDTYIFNFSNDAYYKGEKLDSGFMKLFISNTKDGDETPYKNLQEFYQISGIHKDNVNNSIAVKYEYYIYKYIIKTILDYNINPHFVKFLGGLLDTKSKNIIKFISKKSNHKRSSVEINFSRNIYYMIHLLPGRQSILDDITNPMTMFSEIDKLLYGFILIEGLKKPADINNIQEGETIIFEDYLDKYLSVDYNSVLKLLFQITTGLYALELTKTSHNDLHVGNIFVKKNINTNIYFINDEKYELYSDWNVLLYDFDRSYHEGFINDLLNDREVKDANQTNSFIKKKDFVKIISYVFTHVDMTNINKEQLLDLILVNPIDVNKRKWIPILKDLFIRIKKFDPILGANMKEPVDLVFYDDIKDLSLIIRDLYNLIQNPTSNDPNIPKKVYQCNSNFFDNTGFIIPSNISKAYERSINLFSQSQENFVNLQMEYKASEDNNNLLTQNITELNERLTKLTEDYEKERRENTDKYITIYNLNERLRELESEDISDLSDVE